VFPNSFLSENIELPWFSFSFARSHIHNPAQCHDAFYFIHWARTLDTRYFVNACCFSMLLQPSCWF